MRKITSTKLIEVYAISYGFTCAVLAIPIGGMPFFKISPFGFAPYIELPYQVPLRIVDFDDHIRVLAKLVGYPCLGVIGIKLRNEN